jgi:hypothetical protein
MTSYTRDDQLAVQPETNVGSRIETSGAYVGHFTLAKERTAKTGTKGIEFNFEAEDGRIARYLTLWLTRANGEKIEYPYSLLSALMACLNVKNVETTSSMVDEWSAAASMMMPTEAQIFPELMNKPIGVLLQREERLWEGKTFVSMKIAQFYDPSDRSTPAEIMSGSRAGQALDKLVGNLRESVVRTDAPSADTYPGSVVSTPAAATTPAAAGASTGAFADISDDDVPF